MARWRGETPRLATNFMKLHHRSGAELEEFTGELYAAYCEAVGGKAFNGDPLPTWAEFRADPKKKPQSDAWVRVADLAQERLIENE